MTKPTQRQYAKQLLEEGLYSCNIPEHMWDGIRNYVLDGIQPGSFLTALLADAPFSEVVGRADDINSRNLHNWAMFIHNYIPAMCRRGNVSDWKGIQD